VTAKLKQVWKKGVPFQGGIQSPEIGQHPHAANIPFLLWLEECGGSPFAFAILFHCSYFTEPVNFLFGWPFTGMREGKWFDMEWLCAFLDF